MNRHFQQLLKSVRQRSFRLRAGLTVACWLLLNMQLAIAGHSVAVGHPTAVSAAHHSDRAVVQLLCDKHCHPDNAHSVWQSLHPDALPADAALLPVVQTPAASITAIAWRAPPITGPPAEIRFCRFRE